MLEMTMHGRGIRDMARVLPISPTTVIDALKNAPQLQHVNSAARQRIDPGEVIVEIHQGEDAAVDELWSVLEKTSQHRGLWQAIDHRTGVV